MADVDRILFSEPFRTGRESDYLGQVLASTTWHGDGPFTERSSRWLEDFTGARHSLLTTSGTHALELASILLDLGPGDEVVCPAFTFTSTATAIAIRGATPVFVDVLPEQTVAQLWAAGRSVAPSTPRRPRWRCAGIRT